MGQTNREGQSLLLHAMGCRDGLGVSLQWDALTSAPSSKHLSWGSCSPLWPQEAEQAVSLSADHRYSARKCGRGMLTLKTDSRGSIRKERVEDVLQDEIQGFNEKEIPTLARYLTQTPDYLWCDKPSFLVLRSNRHRKLITWHSS